MRIAALCALILCAACGRDEEQFHSTPEEEAAIGRECKPLTVDACPGRLRCLPVAPFEHFFDCVFPPVEDE